MLLRFWAHAKSCIAAKILVQPAWLATAILIRAWLYEKGNQLTSFGGAITLKLQFPLEVTPIQLYCCKVTAFVVKQVQDSLGPGSHQPVLARQPLPLNSSSVAGDEDTDERVKPAAPLPLPGAFGTSFWFCLSGLKSDHLHLLETCRHLCFLSPLSFLYSPQTRTGVGYACTLGTFCEIKWLLN